MSTTEDKARAVFGARAADYVTSATHADPAVLARVVALARPAPEARALDVATGAGHTALALAPRVALVVATDLTARMLQEARRLAAARACVNVRFDVADVHALPYASGAFNVVTSRRAPHHFSDIGRALGELRRVLRPGGRLVVDDRSGPEDDAVDDLMNELDRLHDESHVRQYRPSAWRRLLGDAGFAVESVEAYVQHRPIGSLTDRVAPDRVARIHARLDALPAAQRAALDLRPIGGVLHLLHFYVTVAAVKAR